MHRNSLQTNVRYIRVIVSVQVVKYRTHCSLAFFNLTINLSRLPMSVCKELRDILAWIRCHLSSQSPHLGHLGDFQTCATTTDGEASNSVHQAFSTWVVTPAALRPKSGIAGSQGIRSYKAVNQPYVGLVSI